MKFIFLTIDGNHAAALQATAQRLRREFAVPLSVVCYDAAALRNPAGFARLAVDLESADFVFGARLFGEDMVRPLERLLTPLTCPVLIIISNPALIKQTRVGKFSLAARSEHEGGILRQWIKKLRPQSGGAGEARRQLAVLRNLSKVLRLIPGKARDLYTYIVAHQFWLNSSPENLYRLLCLLIDSYMPGWHGKLPLRDPVAYPEVALVLPAVEEPFATIEDYSEYRLKDPVLRKAAGRAGKRINADSAFRVLHSAFPNGSVGIVVLRSVALSGNTAHLAALAQALEERGIEARMAYASGLDGRPAIDTFFRNSDGSAAVDLLINATGFALVGGPAESHPADARAILEQLDVGYLGLIPLSFQRVEDWRSDDGGLAPIQSALSVAVPELEGAADPLVYGGSTNAGDAFVGLPGEIAIIADRVAQRVALRRSNNAAKRLAIVIYSFPPNLGNVGTAAYLDVFASLYELLKSLANEGYAVELPADAEALRELVVGGNALMNGTDANVVDQFPVTEYMRRFPQYVDIEPFWGRAPGELLNNGKHFHILGCRLGNVLVAVQPSFGYERDPMRLLMAKDAAPNHAFAAFYTYLRHDFSANAVVHLGTHGALEFMPGKQVGMSANCWRPACSAVCRTSTATASTIPARPRSPSAAAAQPW
ncbi:MAG: DUF3479 domain-containing protein [Oscillochloris sp.]|nr:DUF3479 domain-containing protein [Oscillochloris sp.]